MKNEIDGWTIQQTAAHILSQLTPEDIAYASSTDRDNYRGFAALHDRVDANMLYPQAVLPEFSRCLPVS